MQNIIQWRNHMKKILSIFLLVLTTIFLFGCNSEKVSKLEAENQALQNTVYIQENEIEELHAEIRNLKLKLYDAEEANFKNIEDEDFQMLISEYYYTLNDLYKISEEISYIWESLSEEKSQKEREEIFYKLDSLSRSAYESAEEGEEVLSYFLR